MAQTNSSPNWFFVKKKKTVHFCQKYVHAVGANWLRTVGFFFEENWSKLEAFFMSQSWFKAKKTIFTSFFPLFPLLIRKLRASQQTATIQCKVNKIPFRPVIVNLAKFDKKLSKKALKSDHFTPVRNQLAFTVWGKKGAENVQKMSHQWKSWFISYANWSNYSTVYWKSVRLSRIYVSKQWTINVPWSNKGKDWMSTPFIMYSSLSYNFLTFLAGHSYYISTLPQIVYNSVCLKIRR